MRLVASCAVLLVISVAVVAGNQLPPPWFLAGNDASHYNAAVVSTKEARAFALRSLPGAGNGFGTIMQTFPAEQYRGKRMRFSADVMTLDVWQWAGLWMRVDGAGDPPRTLAFDNMETRPITGTSGWKHYEIVLDVPQEAEKINIGVLLTVKGISGSHRCSSSRQTRTTRPGNQRSSFRSSAACSRSNGNRPLAPSRRLAWKWCFAISG